MRLLVVLCAFLLLAAAPTDEVAKSTALRWLARVDAGDNGQVYAGLTATTREGISRARLINTIKDGRGRLGECKSHKVVECKRAEAHVLVEVMSRFEDGVQATEYVWLSEDADQQWRVSGYELYQSGSSLVKVGVTPR